MFTIEQIKTAHSKVNSGADFPAYVKELIALGVISYETYVADGHTDFYGDNNYKISTPRRESTLKIADSSDAEQFTADLKAHQQGKTEYKTFCDDCSKSGIEKWKVSMKTMTCTYYDKDGEAILREAIPTT